MKHLVVVDVLQAQRDLHEPPQDLPFFEKLVLLPSFLHQREQIALSAVVHYYAEVTPGGYYSSYLLCMKLSLYRTINGCLSAFSAFTSSTAWARCSGPMREMSTAYSARYHLQ